MVTVSNINPEDIPDVPVNKFLMRGGDSSKNRNDLKSRGICDKKKFCKGMLSFVLQTIAEIKIYDMEAEENGITVAIIEEREGPLLPKVDGLLKEEEYL